MQTVKIKPGFSGASETKPGSLLRPLSLGPAAPHLGPPGLPTSSLSLVAPLPCAKPSWGFWPLWQHRRPRDLTPILPPFSPPPSPQPLAPLPARGTAGHTGLSLKRPPLCLQARVGLLQALSTRLQAGGPERPRSLYARA